MKKNLTLICLLFFSLRILAIDGPLNAENSNYVVIGAFALQQNAVQFAEKAKQIHFDAHIDMNPNRQLFYVYVLHTNDRELAKVEATKIRSKTKFWDTWVYSGLLGKSITSVGSDVQPETGEKISLVAANDSQSVTTQETTPVTETITEAVQTTTHVVTTAVVEPAEGNGRNFVFNIFRASNKKPIEGEVDVIDLEKHKKTSSFKGNENVVVRPVNKSGDMSFECEVFGYRKMKYAINFNNPQATEGVVVENGQTVIPFELTRLRKGDIAVMYNVLFYKDAAIMRPESRYEIDGLLQMMKENPNYKIRIHGHTNGSAPGKIIEPVDPKNFFSLSNTKDSFGSAKGLSEERSNLIRNFLISEGIDGSRLEVKAWGGKKPMVEKDHAKAHSNVRVEIEIISE